MNTKVFFEMIADLENNLEMHKQKLINENEEFNTVDAFRLVDEDGEGVVNFNSIERFLNDSLCIRYT